MNDNLLFLILLGLATAFSLLLIAVLDYFDIFKFKGKK